MTRWIASAARLGRQEEAATIVEYTLLMVFVAMACVTAVANFGSAVSGLFRQALNGFGH